MRRLTPEEHAMVDKMVKGDADTILQCLSSSTALLRLNAIMFMTRHKLSSKQFLDKLNTLTDDEFILQGYKICEYCIAALDILGINMYTGSDKRILRLIDSNFHLYKPVFRRGACVCEPAEGEVNLSYHMVGRTFDVVCTDNSKFSALCVEYYSAEENEPETESVLFKDANGNIREIFRNDILTIKRTDNLNE